MEHGLLGARQEGQFAVNAQQFLSLKADPAAISLPRLSREFLYRAALVAIFATMAHQLRWDWLRFLTSEAILHISPIFGIGALRVSFDTLLVQGQFVQFVIACTFVDVYLGSIPLLWHLKKTLLSNVSRLIGVGVLLFIFNFVRLEFVQILYAHRVSWTLADGVVGGFAYFAVWLFIWRQRTWELTSHRNSSQVGHFPACFAADSCLTVLYRYIVTPKREPTPVPSSPRLASSRAANRL